MPSLFEHAWAAGLFDGEGWFSANEKTRAMEMGVGQKTPFVLQRFRAAVGVGRLYAERGNEFHSWRSTTAMDQLTALTVLWPYLSDPKKKQAGETLERVRELRAPLARRVRAVEAAYLDMEGVIRGS